MKYVACYVDHNPRSSGHPNVIGIYDNKEEAKRIVENDLYRYKSFVKIVEHLTEDQIECDKINFEVWRKYKGKRVGCVWSICQCDEHI